MGDKNKKDTLVKRLIKQIAGNLTEEDELIPEVAIIGSGKIWCWDPMNNLYFKCGNGLYRARRVIIYRI